MFRIREHSSFMRPITTRRRRWALVGAVAVSLSSSAWAEPLHELQAAREVCVSGPRAAIARAIQGRASADVSAVKVRQNPELVGEHDRILTGKDVHETTVGLAFSVGIGGRRGLLEEAAVARRSAALADAEFGAFEQALSFREAYVAAIADRARVAVLTEQQRTLEKLSDVIVGLKKGGEVAGYDLLRQENQARTHRRLLVTARARAAASRRLLEAWTGRSVSLPKEVDLTALGGGASVRSRAEATGKRDSSHPRVRELEASARAFSIEAKASRRRAVPDLGLFLGYRAVTTAGSEVGHGFRLGLTVPLTFFDHGQGEAARADADGNLALARAKELERESSARSRSALERLTILEESSSDVTEGVREAETLETKARQLYAAGELSITEFLDAFRAAEEARLARVDLAEELALGRLAVMRARGTQLDPWLDAACGRKP
jgi:outer membrane protein, heavy metal efflux system